MLKKIKTGDEVVIRCGNHKSKRGVVQKVFSKKGTHWAIVSGINIRKKFIRKGREVSVKEVECPIHYSNISHFNRETGKCERISLSVIDNKKCRVMKKSGKVVDKI